MKYTYCYGLLYRVSAEKRTVDRFLEDSNEWTIVSQYSEFFSRGEWLDLEELLDTYALDPGAVRTITGALI